MGGLAEPKRNTAAIESFLGALVKGAKTVSLYRSGHTVIEQVVARVNQLLRAAVGEEPNLVLAVKARSVLCDEEPLPGTEEVVAFASSLHMMGIGQVLFTTRVTDASLLEFMSLLVRKPDEQHTLTDLQREVQSARIEGMQLESILSFVVTGETDEASQKPGQLSEEQVLAFTAAATLPDFLGLLLKQNELLTSKEAEAISELLDGVLNRDVAVEEFEGRLPWPAYDPRIRARWDGLRPAAQAPERWTRDLLVSQLSGIRTDERTRMHDHHTHETWDSFQYALDQVHGILAKPVGAKQPQYALAAYARLLGDLGRTGSLPKLFAECAIWRGMAADPRWASYLAVLRKEVQSRIPTPLLAASIVAHLETMEPDSTGFEELRDFILTVGRGLVPLLIEELRKVTDRTQRQKVCALLAAVCRHFGGEQLVAALKDPDYFLVLQMAGILAELALPDAVRQLAPLLKHEHPKVRAAVVRALARLGGAAAAEAVFLFIATHPDPEESKPAVTALSLMTEPEIPGKLMEAYRRNEDYELRVAVVTALGRFPGRETAAFLKPLTAATFWEWVTRRNKELRETAKRSLKQLAEGKKDGA